MLYVCSRVQLFQCVTRVHVVHLFKYDIYVLSCTVVSMCYTRTLEHSYFNVLHVYTRYIYVNVLNTYSRVQLFQCATRVISCAVISMCYTRTLVVISMCYTHTLGTFISMCYTRTLVYSTFISMCYTRTLVYSYFNVLHAYSRVQLFQCVTRVLSCKVTSMCYTRTLVCSYVNVLHAYSRSYFNVLHAYFRHSYFNVFLKPQVITLQTPQTWANAGVCGGLCACAVGGTYNSKTSIFNVAERVFM